MEKYFISEENRTCVRALFKISDKTATQKVKALKKWVEERPHLPIESKNEDFLDFMLLRGKFRDDVVKKNIENYFNYIKKNPKMFTGLANIVPSDEVATAVVSPKPTPTWERVAILKLRPDQSGQLFSVQKCFNLGLATALIMFNFDYCSSLRLILDFDHMTINHVLQVNLSDLFELISLHENVLKMRISGIELLNAPNLLSVILNLAKMVLKPKLFSRLSTHNDLNSLYKSIPKEYLPRDYGGELQSIKELTELWDQTFLEKRSFFEKFEHLGEKNRCGEDIFGVVGSFKTLAID